MTALLFVVSAWADEPSALSFDEAESLALPAPSAPAVRFAREKRLEAIEFVDELLESDPNVVGDARAALLLKLAHLHHEHARSDHDDDAHREAVRLYGEVQRDFPRFQPDHVGFFLGFACAGVGDTGCARQQLAKVTAHYPISEYAPHAWLHLGELAFAASEYAVARDAYENASAQTFEFSYFVAYKLAWSDRKLERWDDAIGRMQNVALDAEHGPLAIQAFRTVAWWMEHRSMVVSPEFVARHEAAVNAGRAVTARISCAADLNAHRQAIAAAPWAPEAPEFALAIVRCHAAEGRRGPAAAEADRMRKQFGPGSPWWRRQDRLTRSLCREWLEAARAETR